MGIREDKEKDTSYRKPTEYMHKHFKEHVTGRDQDVWGFMSQHLQAATPRGRAHLATRTLEDGRIDALVLPLVPSVDDGEEHEALWRHMEHYSRERPQASDDEADLEHFGPRTVTSECFWGSAWARGDVGRRRSERRSRTRRYGRARVEWWHTPIKGKIVAGSAEEFEARSDFSASTTRGAVAG